MNRSTRARLVAVVVLVAAASCSRADVDRSSTGRASERRPAPTSTSTSTTTTTTVPPSPVVLPPLVVAQTAVPDADWILGAQLPDGAITTQPGETVVDPYLANYAAMGLASATTRRGDARYADAAWRWLDWYRTHEDPSGFVQDHRVVGGGTVPTGSMDSTDAYAGTYLLAVAEAWQATADLGRLRAALPGIDGAVRAIVATQDGDGLTWATPTFRVKYLMDQAEAYAGLRATEDLAAVVGDPALGGRARAAAAAMARGVEGLWDPASATYDWAVHESGARSATDWSQLYPDALEQLWPVAFGLVTGERAKGLVDRFDQAQPGWAMPSTPARIEGRERDAGYWVVAAIAHLRAGDPDTSTATWTIEQAAQASRRTWPFNTGDAGQLLLLGRLSASVPAAAGGWQWPPSGAPLR